MSRPMRNIKSEDELLTTAKRSVARLWDVKAKTLHAFDITQPQDPSDTIRVEVKGANWNYLVILKRNGRTIFNERERI